MLADINCDMGESFGLYSMGDDEAVMPFVSQANVACGFHGSDPNHMRRTVSLAKSYDVSVGAHFSFPDLAGFGRREMKIERPELMNLILYQIGALVAFLKFEGMSLNHLKPHGSLYGVAARDEQVAHAIADAALVYEVPVFGLAGTLHEDIYVSRGIEFHAEFFADLEYDDDGNLIITREHDAYDPERAASRSVRAVRDGEFESINGKLLKTRSRTVCIHSDTPNAVEVAKAVHAAFTKSEAA